MTDIKPNELKAMPEIQKRVEKVKANWLSSIKIATQKLANFPTLFGEIRQKNSDYLLIPCVSSENRKIIPIGFINKDIIVTNRCFFIPNANIYLFGLITSTMHVT